MRTRIEPVIIFLATLAACGPKADVGDDSANASAADAAAELAPAIIPPGEVADPREPPSYEVAIASAAASRNQALGRCKTQPEAVRTQCEQEANAAFADVQTQLQDLRGNKE
jgi:hypothetical protein